MKLNIKYIYIEIQIEIEIKDPLNEYLNVTFENKPKINAQTKKPNKPKSSKSGRKIE